MKLQFYEQQEHGRYHIADIECKYVPLLGEYVHLQNIDIDCSVKTFVCQATEPVYDLVKKELESIIVVLYDDSDDSKL